MIFAKFISKNHLKKRFAFILVGLMLFLNSALAVQAADTTKPIILMNGVSPVNITVGDFYFDAGATATDNVDGNISAQIITVNPVNVMVADTYYVTYNVTDAAGNHADEVTRTVIVSAPPDTTKPVISMNGVSPVNLTVGDFYFDAGATASDNVDGNISAQIVTVNPVNTSVADTYYVTYNVTDAAGNHADEVTRTVIVSAPPDTTKPVISMNGVSPVNLTVGDFYFDAGATASDNVDGNISAQIVTVNPVNTSVADTYYVTYNVTDAAGNHADEVTRTVIVSAPPDTTKPVISMNGVSPVNLTVGDFYFDAGATASDNVDGNISAQIVTVNPVNTSVADTYYVTYNVTDTAGNHADEVTRTVIVSAPPDTTKPVISMNGVSPVNLTVGDFYFDAGATASDNVDGNISAQIVTVNPVNTSVADTYYVTYSHRRRRQPRRRSDPHGHRQRPAGHDQTGHIDERSQPGQPDSR